MYFQIVFDKTTCIMLMETIKYDGRFGLTFHLDHLHSLLMPTKGRDKRLALLKKILEADVNLEGSEDPNHIPASKRLFDEKL